MTVHTESSSKSEIAGVIIRILAGGLIVGLFIVLPALKILSAALA